MGGAFTLRIKILTIVKQAKQVKPVNNMITWMKCLSRFEKMTSKFQEARCSKSNPQYQIACYSKLNSDKKRQIKESEYLNTRVPLRYLLFKLMTPHLATKCYDKQEEQLAFYGSPSNNFNFLLSSITFITKLTQVNLICISF